MAYRKPTAPSDLRPSLAPEEAPFIIALARCQEREDLSDAAFAAKLGISQSLWNHTKRGRNPLGARLLAAGMDLFPPDLKARAGFFLLHRSRKRIKT